MTTSPTARQPRGALEDIRILDLSAYLPGPYASMLLADLGADVIHIEPPSGDAGRAVPPAAGSSSALHQWVARGKRSLVLDLKNDKDHERFLALVAECDVVIEGFTPGVAERLGVDYEACAARNSSVIYCSISGLGSQFSGADAAGHDINFVARAGLLDQARARDGSVVAFGPPVADISAGSHAAVAILAALHYRERSARGQRVEISLLGSALALAGPQLVKALAPRPLGREFDHNLGADPGYRTYRAADGHYLSIGALEPKFWSRLCTVLGRSDLLGLRTADPARTICELEELFATRPRAHWDAMLGSSGACYAPVNSIEEVIDDPYVRERQDIVVGPHTHAGQPRNPIVMSLTPVAPTSVAPELGVYQDLTWV